MRGIGWSAISVRDWRQLEGQTVEGGPEVIECSFYTVEHDLATKTQVRIGDRYDQSFDLQWDAIVEFGGVADGDADAAMRLGARAIAEFGGIQIHSSLVEPDEPMRDRASALLARFVDAERFGRLELRTNEFGVRSWWLRPV
jgi:hypothetical protein